MKHKQPQKMSPIEAARWNATIEAIIYLIWNSDEEAAFVLKNGWELRGKIKWITVGLLMCVVEADGTHWYMQKNAVLRLRTQKNIFTLASNQEEYRCAHIHTMDGVITRLRLTGNFRRCSFSLIHTQELFHGTIVGFSTHHLITIEDDGWQDHFPFTHILAVGVGEGIYPNVKATKSYKAATP